MARVAIIGDSTSVVGFRPLGFAVFPVREPEDARALWDGLLTDGYGTVFVTEPVYAALEDLIAEVVDRPLPAVTVIPGAGSAGGVGEAKLERAIVRALGTSMPITEEEG
ncbi:MAG: V-type ATP synthase subunit F [Coriobacteriia bacterium]|nr:V-type ATP synthase subunit F [Coriobacteriia bacterium]